MLDRYFQLAEHRTTVFRECIAGMATFLTMSYILVVQPNVLSQDFAGNSTGLEPGAVLLATCLSSAFATAMMGIFARLPIALAPGMGQNFFFVSAIMALQAQKIPGQAWQQALAIVFVAGIAFLLITISGLRAIILSVMSPSLRSSIAVGIGLFIAFIGFRNAGVIADAPTLVSLDANALLSVDSGVFWLGFVATAILVVRRVPGSILIGMVVASTAAFLCQKITIDRVMGLPTFDQHAVLQFDFRAIPSLLGISFIIVFVFMDIFDTTGTLIGVTQQAGLSTSGQVPRMQQAMLADSTGTIVGACLGTSTVTSYIESAAGVEQGGRTGLTAITVSLLFIASVFFSPLMIALGSYAPITSPALVIVGAMMFKNIQHIDWQDQTESIVAFLVVLGIPLFFSIADGIALGLVAWPIIKVARGELRQVPLAAYLLAAILVTYFVVVRVNL